MHVTWCDENTFDGLVFAWLRPRNRARACATNAEADGRPFQLQGVTCSQLEPAIFRQQNGAGFRHPNVDYGARKWYWSLSKTTMKVAGVLSNIRQRSSFSGPTIIKKVAEP